MKTVAILTPSYNRAHLLPALYQSLLSQTSRDFTWYIVDDGSADNTADVVAAFGQDAFNIVYLKKPNGGKHTALNVGLQSIAEELTFIVDSDDVLTPDAVETIVTDWQRYGADASLCGLSYYKCYMDGQVVGCPYPSAAPEKDSFVNMRVNRGVWGDNAEVWVTAILRQHPFPEFPGERFMSESVVWHAMSRAGHQMIFIPRGIYLCEYREDGLTKAGRKLRLLCPCGTMEHALAYMTKDVKFVQRCKYALYYAAVAVYAHKIKYGRTRLAKELRPLYAAAFLPGVLLACCWTAKYGRFSKLK